MKLKPIEEQVVVVMGASSGIGRATALALARRGARLVVSARNRQGLDTLVAQIAREGGEARAVVADVAVFEQVQAVAQAAADLYGGFDSWVQPAGVSLFASLEATRPEEFKQVVEINLLGQAYGAMAALPHLRQRGGGALIHVSSGEALRGLPLQSAYSASKQGIHGFVEALRVELAREGAPVSVTEILPANINTPLYDKARTKIGFKPRGLGPTYQPEVVAEAILHAAEQPTRHLFVGAPVLSIDLLQKLSPRLVDIFLRLTAFRGERTDEAKLAGAPDNLFGPIDGFNEVRDDIGRVRLPLSPYTRLVMRPKLYTALKALVAAFLLFLLARRQEKE